MLKFAHNALKLNAMAQKQSPNKHKRYCLWAILLIGSILLYNKLTVKHRAVVLEEMEATVTASIYKFTGTQDSVIGSVKKGDLIKIMGYWENRLAVWAENEAGVRGFIPVEELGISIEARNPNSKKMEVAQQVVCPGAHQKYEVTFKDGTTAKIKKDDLKPDIPRSIRKKILSNSAGKYYMNESDFNRRILGKSLEKIERRAAPAKHIYWSDGKKVAEFISIRVITDKGRMTPVLTFGQEDEAQLKEWRTTNERMIAKSFPFKKMIMGSNILCSMIDASVYEDSMGKPENFLLKILYYALALVIFLLCLVWFFLTPMLPAFIIGYLMYYPKVFKAFSNRALYLLTLVVTLISVYCWIVALGCWGMVFLAALINIWVAIYCFSFITSPLQDYVPHQRCPECRHMHTIKFSKEEYVKEYTQKESERRKVKDLSKETKKWKITKYTTYKYKYRSDYTTSQTEEHGEITTSTLYNDYEVLWKVTVYKITFRCECCGHEESYLTEKYTLLSRKQTGQHVDTNTERY